MLFLLALALKMTSLKYLSCTLRYKKYVFLDPLAGAVTKTHVALETETEEKLFDAPLSITKRGQLDRQVRGMQLLPLEGIVLSFLRVEGFCRVEFRLENGLSWNCRVSHIPERPCQFLGLMDDTNPSNLAGVPVCSSHC